MSDYSSSLEVARIAALNDAVIRNLQITQSYHELSAILAGRTGLGANWCTFATWASKQAGQTIRKEDLARLFERRLRTAPALAQASRDFEASARQAGAKGSRDPQPLTVGADDFSHAIDLASQAVGRGNHKVYEEIGREFARFYTACLPDERPDAENIASFCEKLRPGDPPNGQRYLSQAFTHYYQALFEADAKGRSELILLANIEIGFHEQTRLQPEIAESLDAGLTSSLQFSRNILARLFPFRSWLILAHQAIMRRLGRPTALDLALRALLEAGRAQLRQALTELMLTIYLPEGETLRLGEDLPGGYPPSLAHIANPELISLLEMLDPTSDSPVDSGARDWANLPDRLHFIIDFFRSYQERPQLFEPPFTAGQVEVLKAGRLPVGRL